jgi:hypothetical protein
MVNTFMPRNPLAAALSEEGVGRSEAASEAHANLEGLRAESMAELDRSLELMARIAPPIVAIDDPDIDELYAAANRVVAIAGVFSLHDLSGHAYELCEAIGRMLDAEEWKPAIVLGHVEALQAARSA